MNKSCEFKKKYYKTNMIHNSYNRAKLDKDILSIMSYEAKQNGLAELKYDIQNSDRSINGVHISECLEYWFYLNEIEHDFLNSDYSRISLILNFKRELKESIFFLRIIIINYLKFLNT